MKKAGLHNIVDWLDGSLQLARIPGDDSNNGLQVEGKPWVSKAFFSVDACGELFERAAAAHADFIFVHHGLSWRDNMKRLTGLHAKRVTPLFAAGVSLYAAHLPLDAHPVYGHNILLAKMLSLRKTRFFANYHGVDIGVLGDLPRPVRLGRLAASLTAALQENVRKVASGGRTPQGACYTLGEAERLIRRVGIISGGAGHDGLMAAAACNVDCFIVGEFGHSSYHAARETGTAVIALGHYLSETPGVIDVMARLRRKFDISCEFVDIPTGL